MSRIVDLIETPLNESSWEIHTKSGPVHVWENPRREVAQSLLAKWKSLRGVVIAGKDVYIWNAWEGIHAHVADRLTDSAWVSFAIEPHGKPHISTEWEEATPDYQFSDFDVYGTTSTLPILQRLFPPNKTV